jgi:hypothetical protein
MDHSKRVGILIEVFRSLALIVVAKLVDELAREDKLVHEVFGASEGA